MPKIKRKVMPRRKVNLGPKPKKRAVKRKVGLVIPTGTSTKKPQKSGYDDADLRGAIAKVNKIAKELGGELIIGFKSGQIIGYRIKL